jgi:hypothetical protein
MVAAYLLPKTHIAIIIIFIVILVVTMVSLALTACSNPGILPRYNAKPAHGGDWTYSDQTSTFRPRGAVYCGDCNVVIEGKKPGLRGTDSIYCGMRLTLYCMMPQISITPVLGLELASGSEIWATSMSLQRAVACC